MATFVKAAKTGDLRPGDGKVVEIGGKSLALFNVEGRFYCIDSTCVHRGGPIGEGFLDGTIVTCPWHGWQFDLTDGCGKTNPASRIGTYEVKVEGDDLLVAV